MKLFLNAAEIAKLLEVDRATVIRWIRKGIIHNAQRVKGTRQWQIPLAEYEALRKYNHESRSV